MMDRWTSSSSLGEAKAKQAARTVVWGQWMIFSVLGVFALLVVRVVQLKVAPDDRLHAAVGSSLSSRPELARTGDLVDRRGRTIATSSVGQLLFLDPQAVEDLSTVALDIATIARMDPAEIDRKIAERPDSRYIVLTPLADEDQIESVKRANIAGLGLKSRLVRYYPHDELAAGLVGRVGFDQIGQTGFERIFNSRLKPTDGRLTYLRDVQRRPLWIDPDGYQPGRDGQAVRLSIDMVIQDIAETRLTEAVKHYNAGGGRMIIMDCRTGELLAMTDVINNRPGWSEPIIDADRAKDPRLARNRCVTDPYEPGSTFKPFIWAAATEMGKARVDEVLPTPGGGGWRTPYGRLIRDTHYYGPSTWHKVLVKSMNTGMAMIAERMTHKEMQDAVARFGFGRRVGCGLPGETAGIVTSPKQWSKYTQSSVSFGHEIAVTPLQMVQAFSAFARDGSMITPRITAAGVPGAGLGGGSKRAMKPEIAAIARDAMRHVMTEGTGRLAESHKYQMFGKSGTAQLPRADRKGYHENRYVASFIAAAPYEDPQVIVLCVIDDPDRSKGHLGGAIAGPVVKTVMEETLTYLGVPEEEVPDDADAIALAE